MTFKKGHTGFPKKATPAAGAGPDLGQFRVVLDNLTSVVTTIAAQQQEMNARIGIIENATPRFLPIEHQERQQVIVDVDPKAMRAATPYMSTQEMIANPTVESPALRGNIPVNSEGVELSADFILRYKPLFRIGARVKINPDAKIHIGDDEQGNPVYRTHREEYHKARRRLDTVGEVLRFQRFSTPHKTWKYSVRFPGITRHNGGGYYETELLPA